MNYNTGMPTVLVLALALVLPAAAADKPDAAGTADKTVIELVDYFLKTPTADANPKLVEPFLALDPDALPKRQREKARAKQLEIRTLVRLHDTKKKGSILMPAEGCTLESFVHPQKDYGIFAIAGFGPITEDDLTYVMQRTHCTELDLGCQFSLTIFFDKGSKKPRRLMLHENDPVEAIVAEGRHSGKSNQTNFFGLGLTCNH